MNASRIAIHAGRLAALGLLSLSIVSTGIVSIAVAEEPATPKAIPTGDEPGWKLMGKDDFVVVNGADDTWAFPKEGMITTTGRPVGVMRTAEQYENFEALLEWRHLEKGGNSGLFAWASEKVLTDLPPGRLPGGGIEVQILDTGYAEKYTKATGKEPDWFTSHGDVFPVGSSKMKPFPPVSPNGNRSFPSKETTKDVGEWNHYYVRGVDGEIRLWVNGEEVSGGSDCQPASGYLCLEAEGAPVEFRNFKLRRVE